MPSSPLIFQRFSSFRIERVWVPPVFAVSVSCSLRDLIFKSVISGQRWYSLRKLDAGEYDAIILASAGLIRLGLQHRINERLSFDLSLPAGGQGAVGIECRADDEKTFELIQCLHHHESAIRVSAERAVNEGWTVAVRSHASYAEVHQGSVFLRGLVGALDGSVIYRSQSPARRSTPGNWDSVSLKIYCPREPIDTDSIEKMT